MIASDCTNINLMRKTLAIDGYLYLKNFIPLNEIEAANNAISGYLLEHQYATDDSLTINENSPLPSLLADQIWIREQPSMRVLSHPKVQSLLENILQTPLSPIPFKWLRAVSKDLFTGLHSDRTYVGHISPKTIGTWIPICQIPPERGSLIVCPESAHAYRWSEVRDRAVSLGSDGTKSGWITSDLSTINLLRPGRRPAYYSSSFEMGDLVILSMDVLHMTAANITSQYRISCDTRYIF